MNGIDKELIPAAMRSRRQWVLWKYEHRGTKPTKVPYRLDGRPASSVDPEHWATFDEVLGVYSSGSGWSGVGFVFAEGDDWVGVDLDECLDPAGQPYEWAIEILEHLAGYSEISPSGRGIKIFCRGQFPVDRGRNVRLPEGGGIELYARGRYFTVTGRRYWDDSDQESTQGLAWLASRYFASGSTATPPSPHVPSRGPTIAHDRFDAVDRASRYADAYPPAVSGQNGHGVTYRLACVLTNGFDLGRDDALSILGRWNERCDPPWSARELDHKIQSAIAAGGDRGYMLTDSHYAASVEPATPSEYEVYLGDLLAGYESRLSGALPPHLYHVPGFVQDVATWITTQNPRPNLLLSLLAGLALQAALVARKVRDRTGARTNLYLVALAPSSGGKQAPQTCTQEVLGLTNQAGLYGGKVASDSAIAQDLMTNPAKLYILDEFGRFLKKTREDRGGSHLHAVQETLLELWGATRNPLWKHKSMADSKFNREIAYPCVSLLGFSVPGNFWDGLEECHLTDGFAARLIVVDTGPKPESVTPIEAEPPQSVLDRATYWRDFAPGGDLAKAGRYVPIVIPSTDEAEAAFSALVKHQETFEGEVAEAVWSRAIEKSRRLAMVYACSRDHLNPIVDIDAARWAIDFVKWATAAFLSKAADEVTGGEVFQIKYKRVLKLIREKSRKKHVCTRSILLRSTKWRAKELDEVLGALEAGEEIEKADVGDGRSRAVAYRIRK